MEHNAKISRSAAIRCSAWLSDLLEVVVRKTEKEIIERTRCVSIICDCCKKEFDNDMDLQEFLTYYNTGGYSRESQIHVT